MKKIGVVCLMVVLMTMVCNPLLAQRKMEALDRGLVAVKVSNGVFLSWRINGWEWYNTKYNVYRDGVLLNTAPLDVSNYNDASGAITSSYTVKAVVNGAEQAASTAVVPLAQQYLEVPLKTRDAVYEVNDMTTADLDGDGQYELIVKRIVNDWSVAATNFAYFEAYKLDGTFLWEINVGPNIMSSSAVEINIAAFDFDEDGKAEVFMRTSEGTIFGDGTKINDTDGDGVTNYRYSVTQTANMQYMCAGPEFLSLVNGETGAELHRVAFIPRGNVNEWGDGYGHRANKFFFGAPYLDGKKPSLFIGRGIYTKTIMRTYDVVNKKLVLKWQWSATSESDPYYGQGNHNYTIADTDGDGCDEIAWGSMVVDNNGQGLFSTAFGHGDAIHVGNFDPYRKGTEIFKCLEESPNWGTTLYDGKTGEILIHHVTTDDCGRACAANVSNDFKGSEVWGGGKMFSATTHKQVAGGSVAENYRIYWDGDLLEEETDHVGFSTTTGSGTGAIMKFGSGTILTATGSLSCNYTKGTPSLQADLFGDWREEVIWRRADNQAVRIYTTVAPTVYRNYSLMYDHQYRQAVCWQMCGYNQPPHVSYFLGQAEGMEVPPPPVISNQRLVYKGTGVWDKSSTVWDKDGVQMTYADGEHVLFDESMGTDITVTLGETVSPEVLSVNTKGNCNINAASGKLSGSMVLAKQGAGNLVLVGNHDYSGSTNIWDGKFVFNGELQQSPVWLNLHAEMAANGLLAKGVTVRYNAVLSVAAVGTAGTLTIGDNLTVEEGGVVLVDLAAPASASNDVMTLTGNLVLADKAIIRVNPLYTGGATSLEPGDYIIATISGSVTGDLTKVVVDGIDNNWKSLEIKDGKLVLVIKPMRAAATLLWNGGLNNDAFDYGITQNFTNNGNADWFMNGDNVSVTEAATSKTINFVGNVAPTSLTIDNTSTVTLGGEGRLSGNSTLSKSGTGKLIINNDNDFTGKVLISAGTVEVTTMPNLKDISAFGPTSSIASNFEINGGILKPAGDLHSDRAMFIGANGGTIDVAGKLYLDGNISGGNLIKTGSGNIYFSGINALTSLTLKGGVAVRQNDATSTGSTVIFEGGTYQDKDDNYSSNTNNVNLNVATGKTGTFNLDSRCSYTGALTGAGTLTVNIPFVRADLNGNWSAFTGTINLNSTYSNTSGYDAELRVGNTNGYANAVVVINANVYASHLSNAKVAFGSLTGLGTLGGSGNWEIGAKNTTFTFGGVISGGSLTKVGTGRMTLTSDNAYTGGTTISNGSLVVSNTSGSATGSGSVSCTGTGSLTGTGFVSGKVYVGSGCYLLPGNLTAVGTLTVNNTVSFNAGSIFYVDVDADTQVSDVLKTTGAVTVSSATLMIRKNSGTYSDGDQFKIFDSPSISGSFTTINPATPGTGLAWDLSSLNTLGVVKVAVATGIQKTQTESLSFYPNPTNGLVNIQLGETNGNGMITVEDATGRTVLQKAHGGQASQEIDLNGFNRGVYVIRLILDDKVLVGKVILN